MGKRLSNVVWYWLPLAAYAGTIFALSSMSHPPIPNLHWRHADKVLHALEFAGLAGLLCRGLAMGGKGLTPRAAFRGALLASVLYALAD
ncbi:MAG: hypothetical protein HY901_24515, partial [Deltaproteobacteria bacterium]|nr:hypothetical protein [Deltaproteobacteria bacterium]